MMGNGLQSLIPNKNGSGQVPNDESSHSFDSFNPHMLHDESSDDEAVFHEREERSGLGVLSYLGNAQKRGVQPLSQPQPYTPQQVEPSSQSSFISTPPPRPTPVPPLQTSSHKTPMLSGPVFQVELDKITTNPYQPRTEFDQTALDELASSIRELGILQPLVVSKIEEETDRGMAVNYQLIAGHRRLLAAKRAGLSTVPVIIRNALKKTEALEMAIVENIQRQDLNVIETARAYARLSDEFGLTQREIATRLGKSRESVANTLRLLSLPTTIQDALSQGKINESHARILMQIGDITAQERLFQDIVHQNLSVRDIKKRLEATKLQGSHLSQSHATSGQDMEFKYLERQLSDHLGAPVQIEVSKSGGRIIVHFYSPEEARGIADKIKKQSY